MAIKTKIEWADYITNPIKARVGGKTGHACVPLSEGCAHCWASTFNVRLGTGLDYTATHLAASDVFLDEREIERLLKIVPKGPYKNGRSRAVFFPCDMTDLFGDWVPLEWQERLFDAFAMRTDLDWLVLTKRAWQMDKFVESLARSKTIPPNVYLGVSIENQRRAAERLDAMYRMHLMGWKTWVSYEPALGSVDWKGWYFLNGLICGGESGHGARPMHPDWARGARDFCQANRIPFFFKQWGAWFPVDQLAWLTDRTTFAHQPINVNGTMMVKLGKGMAGHVLDGHTWNQMPLSTDFIAD